MFKIKCKNEKKKITKRNKIAREFFYVSMDEKIAFFKNCWLKIATRNEETGIVSSDNNI